MVNWGGWEMDVTTFTMLLTCRLWSVGFVIADGTTPDAKLNEGQRKRKMKKKPSLVEFLSYCFFGPTSMVGPFYELHEYLDYIEFKGIYQRIPSGVLPSLWRILEGLCCLVLHIAIGTYFPLSLCGSSEFPNQYP